MKDFMDSYKIFLDVAQWLFSGAVAFVLWQVKRDKSQDTQSSDFRKEVAHEVAEIKVRLAGIDERLKHVPSSDETAKLTARIDALDKTSTALNNNIQRLNDFLLNNK